jgi:carboxyl-terminal processing protease
MASEPTGLILDLRNNPGGGLSTAVDIADHFLGEGPILIERFGNGTESLFAADEKGLAQNVPLVVLINEGSASASEVVAGAIHDRERGVLIGAKSFGKGTVQTWRRLSNNGGLRVTVARWLTPDGTWVDNEGLTPDITVSIPESEEGVLIDTQLQRAIEYLLGQPAANK